MRPIRIVIVVASIMALPASVLAQPAPSPAVLGAQGSAAAWRRCGLLGRGAQWRDQGSHPGDYRGDRQALRADGQPRVSLRHDRAAADRFAGLDQGQPVDPRQVQAVWPGRSLISSRGRSRRPGRAAMPRVTWSCRSSSGCCSNQAGWSPATKGPQRGPVVHVKAQSADELSPYKGKLKGAWVLLSEVSVQPSPKAPRTNLDGEMRRRMRDFSRLREFRPASESSWSRKEPPGS